MKKETVPPDKLTAITEETFRNLRIKKRLTEDEFPAIVDRLAVAPYGTTAEAAKQWKVSRQYLEQILDGSRPVPKNMCDALGYTKEKITFYVKD